MYGVFVNKIEKIWLIKSSKRSKNALKKFYCLASFCLNLRIYRRKIKSFVLHNLSHLAIYKIKKMWSIKGSKQSITALHLPKLWLFVHSLNSPFWASRTLRFAPYVAIISNFENVKQFLAFKLEQNTVSPIFPRFNLGLYDLKISSIFLRKVFRKSNMFFGCCRIKFDYKFQWTMDKTRLKKV